VETQTKQEYSTNLHPTLGRHRNTLFILHLLRKQAVTTAIMHTFPLSLAVLPALAQPPSLSTWFVIKAKLCKNPTKADSNLKVKVMKQFSLRAYADLHRNKQLFSRQQSH